MRPIAHFSNERVVVLGKGLRSRRNKVIVAEPHPLSEMAEWMPREDRIESLFGDLYDISRIFYQKGITAVFRSPHSPLIVNTELGGKAEVVILTFQLMCIAQALPRYLSEKNSGAFLESLLQFVRNKKYGKIDDLFQCYMHFGREVTNKLLYYFSVDVGKYMLGYESEGMPSSFPCLSSYISSGIPREILARTDVTQVSLVVQPIIPHLKTATNLAVAYYFNDTEKVRQIETELS
jgi:hypothetical protein